MKVSVFGAGYVGVVASGCLASSGHEVVAVDASSDKVSMINRGRSPIVEAEIDEIIASGVRRGALRATEDAAAAVAWTDISIISVGTPSAPNGGVSTRAVEDVCVDIGRALRRKAMPHAIVMRSTVPPGTADERAIPIIERECGMAHGDGFLYYSNPEFLREGTSVRDFRSPPFTLIGAPVGDDATVLREPYAGIDAPVHVASYRVVESAKYLSNAYHAVKLAFANEAGQILAAHGVDARDAFRLFCEDGILNISTAYLRPGFAFGGSCLPKDIRGFLALARAKDVPAPFLANLLPSNSSIINRLFESIARLGRQRICLLGLAFKQGTDDLRESPFVVLAEMLIARGFDLRIYDRDVQVARLVGSNRDYIDYEIPHLKRLLFGDVASAVEGSGVVVVGHIAPNDQSTLLAEIGGQVVFDLEGIPELERKEGISYRGICW